MHNYFVQNFLCENEKNTICRQEFFNNVGFRMEIDSCHFQNVILAIDKM